MLPVPLIVRLGATITAVEPATYACEGNGEPESIVCDNESIPANRNGISNRIHFF
jgi:hypothetical protein